MGSDRVRFNLPLFSCFEDFKGGSGTTRLVEGVGYRASDIFCQEEQGKIQGRIQYYR